MEGGAGAASGEAAAEAAVAPEQLKKKKQKNPEERKASKLTPEQQALRQRIRESNKRAYQMPLLWLCVFVLPQHDRFSLLSFPLSLLTRMLLHTASVHPFGGYDPG